MKKIILFLALIAFTGIITADDRYLASFKIHSNNEFLGSPSIKAIANKQAGITVDNSYKLSFSIKPTKANNVYLLITLNIQDQEYSPSMEVVLGEETSFIFNELKMSVLITRDRKY